MGISDRSRSGGVNLKQLVARQTVISLALQALIERLLITGRIDPVDLVTMREFGLQLSDQLKAHGSTSAQIGGERVEAEIRAWWDMVGVPATMGR